MSAARLVIEGLCKSYASPVLTDVNLQIDEGEIHAIVGENGAGKTTLMRSLGGLTRPDEGTIRVRDEEVRFTSAADAAARAGVGDQPELELDVAGAGERRGT